MGYHDWEGRNSLPFTTGLGAAVAHSVWDRGVISSNLIVPTKMIDDSTRWEFCPHCGDGWPDFVGTTKTHHQFSCTYENCEGFYTVKIGVGDWDRRHAKLAKLDPEITYFTDCEGCKQRKPVKLKNWRLVCRDCFKKFNICKCDCTCGLD